MNRRRPAILSAIVVAILFIVSAWAWTQLPADAQVPIHWDIDGTPDGFASKTIGLLLLPLITAGVAALFWIIPIIEPRRANILKSEKAYTAIWLGIVLLLAAVDLVAVAAAMGSGLNVSTIVPIGVGALFILIGNYLPKVRPNYMVGIRTPWTLTSDLSWDRTHRVGGRLFVVEGIAFILFGLLRPPRDILIGALIGGIAVVLVFLFAYSYQVWKTDPARRIG
jgi:uncharacterized membrane protein